MRDKPVEPYNEAELTAIRFDCENFSKRGLTRLPANACHARDEKFIATIDALVAKAEAMRERCAKVCGEMSESMLNQGGGRGSNSTPARKVKAMAFAACAAAIRALHDDDGKDAEQDEHDPECACPACCDRRAGNVQIGPCGEDA